MRKIQVMRTIFIIAVMMVTLSAINLDHMKVYAAVEQNFYDTFDEGTSLPDGWSKFAKSGYDVSVGVEPSPQGEGNSVKMYVNAATDPSLTRTLSSSLKGRVVIEQDICVEDTICTRFFVEIKESGDTKPGQSLYNFGNDGKIRVGSSVMPYEVDQWYHVKVDIDTNTGIYTVLVTDTNGDTQEFISNYTFGSGNDIEAFRNRVKGNIGPSVCYVDNVKIYDIPSLVTNSPELDGNDLQGIRPTFHITFNNEIDQSSLNTISVDAVEATVQNAVYGVEYQENSNTCLITFGEDLQYATAYQIDLSGIKDVYGQQIDNHSMYAFTTQDDVKEEYPLVIGETIFKKGFGSQQITINTLEPGLISGETAVINQSTEIRNVSLIMTLQKENASAPVRIGFVNADIAPNETKILNVGFDVPDNGETYYIKIFVWDGIETMEPLSDMMIFDSEGIRNAQ